MILSVLVGLVAGFGAVFFDFLLKLSLTNLIDVPMAWLHGGPMPTVTAPGPGASMVNWLIIPIAGLGGLASGLLVFLVAPEAEGHGTDAMIESFHMRGGYVRRRAPLIKILASALTIGSGGSAGKEGPIAQIGSGFGSILASFLKMKPTGRRILLLAGAAGGIGAIFQAPLGAALFVPSVLYRDTEYEFEAILPCIVSSITAYAVFTKVFGRQALFVPGPVNFDMPELLPYAVFGVVCAGVGYLYIKFFYGLRDHFFRPLPIPKLLKPALGGLLLGCVAWYHPGVIDGGYAWIQSALEGQILWQTMALLVLLKIVATSFTISSGGSGGVFGPSVYIGAMLGGAFGYMGHALFPNIVVNPNAFVLVGMGGFFAGVAKVPVASVIMACEMSSSYTLLVPLMLVSTISFLLLTKVSLYEKQMINRLASPAHLGDFARGLLEGMTVGAAAKKMPVSLIAEDTPFDAVVKIVTGSKESYFPVVNKAGKMTGILSINDIRQVIFDDQPRGLLVAKDMATPKVARVSPDDSLQTAMDIMVKLQIDELPVVSNERPDEIETMLSKQDIINHYHNCCKS
jgi:CIC family chloride channel protein